MRGKCVAASAPSCPRRAKTSVRCAPVKRAWGELVGGGVRWWELVGGGVRWWGPVVAPACSLIVAALIARVCCSCRSLAATKLSSSACAHSATGKKLHYKGAHFHRIIGSFMCQGGGIFLLLLPPAYPPPPPFPLLQPPPPSSPSPPVPFLLLPLLMQGACYSPPPAACAASLDGTSLPLALCSLPHSLCARAPCLCSSKAHRV